MQTDPQLEQESLASYKYSVESEEKRKEKKKKKQSKRHEKEPLHATPQMILTEI